MQAGQEHHRLLDISSHSAETHLGQDDAAAFVGHSIQSHHHYEPISTNKHSKRGQDRSTNPALWNTKEFYFYYLVFAFCLPYMFKSAHDASSEDNPNYEKYSDLLSEGFFGYKVDNSDGQYAGFRNNLPTLVGVVCVYIPLSHLFKALIPSSSFLPLSSSMSTSVSKGFSLLQQPLQPLFRTYFFLMFSLVYLYYMFGNSILKIGAIVIVNYLIAKMGQGARWMPVATWTFNLIILFLNEAYDGYNFRDFHESLAWLDENRGVNRRWDVHFNFTMLRLVSFNMDYYWSFHHPTFKGIITVDHDNRVPQSDKERVSTPSARGDYCFTYYLAYALYAPLFIAGPIITFNDFVSQ
ncbi:glycerol transporter, partial [Lobosporangium transversale]